jgi:hypothetical protein
LLKSAATITRETKPFKKVFSYQPGEHLLNRVASTYRGRSQKADQQADKTVDPRRDQHRSEKTRSKEIKVPEQRNHDRSEKQRIGSEHIVKEDCSDE